MAAAIDLGCRFDVHVYIQLVVNLHEDKQMLSWGLKSNKT